MNSDLMKLAIPAGVLFAAWKFGNAPIRAMALSVAAVAIAKRVPYVQDAI